MYFTGTDDDLEFYVRKCGEILGVIPKLDKDQRDAKHILEHIFFQVVEFKKLNQVNEPQQLLHVKPFIEGLPLHVTFTLLQEHDVDAEQRFTPSRIDSCFSPPHIMTKQMDCYNSFFNQCVTEVMRICIVMLLTTVICTESVRRT